MVHHYVHIHSHLKRYAYGRHHHHVAREEGERGGGGKAGEGGKAKIGNLGPQLGQFIEGRTNASS